MNDHKICFIYCVNDEALFSESVRYINQLHIPDGYEIEILPVTGAKSMTSGYNFAMKQSDAKYKVYLHQDVFIIEKDFIIKMVNIFRDSPELGMLGVAGAKKVPVSGVWWEAEEKIGKVYESHTGRMELLSFNEVKGNFEPVEAIDGLIMATQIDLPWRDDLFHGWHFYDTSHSVEFINAGFKVGIPYQDNPWCVHDCGLVNVRNGYKENLQIFLNEYSKYLFPKVSVLIPTYNRPQYFEKALCSVLAQTYKNIEVIICDDSTNDETEILIQKYLSIYRNIRYYKNEHNLGQFDNSLKCFNLATGQYINYLMDDDLFHSEKIEKMMKYYLSEAGNEITLVTSHRQIIDKNGDYLSGKKLSRRLCTQDELINGIKFAEYLLQCIPYNYIGEPTTVLFRKDDLIEPFGTFSERRYMCNVDLASWVLLLSKGNMVYIAETLSYFRIHGNQQLQSEKMLLGGAIDFAHQLLEMPKYGFYEDRHQYKKAVSICLRYIRQAVLKFSDRHIDDNSLKELYHYTSLLQKLYEELNEDNQDVTIE